MPFDNIEQQQTGVTNDATRNLQADAYQPADMQKMFQMLNTFFHSFTSDQQMGDFINNMLHSQDIYQTNNTPSDGQVQQGNTTASAPDAVPTTQPPASDVSCVPPQTTTTDQPIVDGKPPVDSTVANSGQSLYSDAISPHAARQFRAGSARSSRSLDLLEDAREEIENGGSNALALRLLSGANNNLTESRRYAYEGLKATGDSLPDNLQHPATDQDQGRRDLREGGVDIGRAYRLLKAGDQEGALKAIDESVSDIKTGWARINSGLADQTSQLAS